MLCFAIKDEKTSCFMSPFFVRHKPDAIRSLTRVVNDPDNNLCRFAADYSLWVVGIFDDMTGEIKPEIYHELNLVTLKSLEVKNG